MSINFNNSMISPFSPEVHQLKEGIDNKKNESPLTVQTIDTYCGILALLSGDGIRYGRPRPINLPVTSTDFEEVVDTILKDFTRIYNENNNQFFDQLNNDSQVFCDKTFHSESKIYLSYEKMCQNENKFISQEEKKLFTSKLAEINVLIFLCKNELNLEVFVNQLPHTMRYIQKDVFRERYYQKFISKIEQIEGARVILAQIHSWAGAFDACEKIWDEMIASKKEPEFLLFFLRGTARIEQKKDESAKEDFSKVTEILESKYKNEDVTTPEESGVLARCYLHIGQMKNALSIIEQMFHFKEYKSLFGAGYTTEISGRYCDITHEYRFENMCNVNYNAAEIYLKAGQYEKALEHIQKSLSSKPGIQDFILLESKIRSCQSNARLFKNTTIYNRSSDVKFIYV